MSPSAGDKTEQATPKKRRDARNKGQVAKSNDFNIAISMLVLLGALRVFGPFIVGNMLRMVNRVLTWQIPQEASIESTMHLLVDIMIQFAIIVLPMLGVALLVGFISNVVQVGFKFTPEAIKPKFSRINPISGFKKVISKRSLIELVKSTLKIVVLGFVAYTEYQVQIANTRGMMGVTISSLQVSITAMVDMIFAIGFKLCLALIIMAPFDLFYQRWKHNKDLMMSKQEVKDEYKLTEGDPQIKGKIKQKQREMAAMRMMQAVGGADVVITNPTHYAVALAYDDSKHVAPVIIAMGKDFVAQRIKEEADKHGIPKIENRPLAQYLYFFCEIGQEVPEEMYQAVAEVLAYIYRLRNGARREGVR